MALDIETGFKKLFRTIALGEKGYHQDYARVVKLADQYEHLITGDDAGKLLHQFTPRENKTQFKQRVRLTQLVTPAISEKIMQPFYKVSRIDNVSKLITFESDNTEAIEKKVAVVEESLKGFYGDETLEDFMETRLVELVFTDPNSFLIVEFDEFDNETGRAKPFPYEVSSKEAINYKYKNNVLQYLIVRKDINYLVLQKDATVLKESGYEYRLYLNNQVLKLVQIDANSNAFIEAERFNTELINEAIIPNIKIGTDVFKITLAEPLGGEVQAIRVGYKRDITTKGRTYLSPLQPAVPRMMKTVKSVSELDLTTTLHTFPQKLQYVQACKGEADDVCRDGFNRKQAKCKACSGSGVVIHTSAADAITLPLPKDKEEMLDLDKLLIYKAPPVDLIKWQDEYVEKLERKSLTDVFVSESLNQITKTQTATEKELDMESIYDTLLPFANKYSAIYKKVVKMIAAFTDNENAIIIHSFPKDFKLKTEKALLADLKAAKDADAPTFLKTEIENDIAVKVYADQPHKMRVYEVKQQHIPFSGKTPEEITISINMGLTTQFDKILYANFDSILTDIDQEQLKSSKDFYLMPYDDRVEIIKAKVADYIKIIDGERTDASMFGADPVAPKVDVVAVEE
jgi:hypothetical protein